MEQLSITPMVSIRPDRISFTTFVRRIRLFEFIPSATAGVTSASNAGEPRTAPQSVLPKLVKKFHNFEISKNSQRNLKDKISYLFQFARSRNIRTYNGKNLVNFKVCFLTLTLPSAQVHPSAAVIEKCFQPFLEVLRKRLKMMNYVYRIEFQTNGNIHFHMATDTYIDYFFAQKHWNRIIEQLGYVTRYANSMLNLSYNEYLQRYSQGGKIPAAVLYKRYLKGKASKWQNPNSVDVKNAKSSDNIGWYISKYFSKKEKGAKCNSLDNEENSMALRLCFWSRSLSKCKAESMPFDYYNYNFERIFEKLDCVNTRIFDYCKVVYFSFNKLPAWLKSILGEYFQQQKFEAQYVPA